MGEIKHYRMVHPSRSDLNEHIRIFEDDINDGDLIHIGKSVGIVIRPATFKEIEEVDDLEAEMEAHEPDIGFVFPTQWQAIRDLAWAWSNPLSIQEILHIIASECRNGCSSPSNMYEYFSKQYRNQVDLREITVLSNVLNFSSIREQSGALFSMTAKKD